MPAVVPLPAISANERVRIATRFWPKVECPAWNECWSWLGSCERDDRGTIKVCGRAVKAPRVAWLLTYGEDPDGFVCHHCDNPNCVNPMHLWIGDALANSADMVRKGRAPNQRVEQCGNGHPLTFANTRWTSGKLRRRVCRRCEHDRVTRYRHRAATQRREAK